jgi:hypothetical protein
MVCAAPLVVNVVLFSLITFGGRDFSWKQARMVELGWLVAGQAVAVLVGTGTIWLFGALRTMRRRAPVLRRRHAVRYVGTDELADLRLNAPAVADLVARAVHHRDRLADSRTLREGWLTTISAHDLDATLWHLTKSALATAATMDAVNAAEDYPDLREHALAGRIDLAATTRALRAKVTRINELADAAAIIDAALAGADRRRHRLRHRDYVHEQLTMHRAALADGHLRDTHQLSTDDVEAAVAVARYTAQELTRSANAYKGQGPDCGCR